MKSSYCLSIFILCISFFLSTQCSTISVKKKKPFNFAFNTREIVQDSEKDYYSYSKILINGKDNFKTTLGKLSETKSVEILLSPDNYLIKITKYVQDPSDGMFKPILDQYQPKERFVKVKERNTTYLNIKYTGRSRRYEMKADLIKK